MKTFLTVLTLLLARPLVATQIVAGSQEDKMFQRVYAEKNSDAKLQQLTEYETQFPQSKVLTTIYSMAMDIYRERGDRDKSIEYGEKILRLDDRNVTAMMVLSRNYAMQGKNLDRAVDLAQKAVDRILKMKTESAPSNYTDAKWKEYLASTEASAQNILTYTKSVKARESLTSGAASSATSAAANPK